ncbi:formamidopyrimidine-DNA glycosylase [Edwardsiella tarda]|uniref:formamidopyrimidine-DNA glycosylase n=1 Tax=Edwardsiella tarda TaxID=636 RepID=UPI00098EBF36|nr:formamidopyrimidine-DNA glycosylase [Edwardsiella tarda]
MQGTAEVIPRSGASGERRGSREADEAESAVHGLLALRYTACARCGRRIRVRLHSVLSRCHTWCPYCRENVPLCRVESDGAE